MDEQYMSSPSADTEHQRALVRIRQKMEQVAEQYANGKLNPAQFNAIYRHYIEKRLIIEKLIERNPETNAWRSVAEQGQTSFLLNHFESRVLYYIVFQHGSRKPLISGGNLPEKAIKPVHRLLQVVWNMEQPRQGLARKNIGDGRWAVLALGKHAMTLTVFSLQPARTQINRIGDMHNDFERANQLVLARGLSPKRMVYPQRALIEETD